MVCNTYWKKGRQPTYTDIAIQFALTIRNLFQLALRQTQGFIQSFCKWLTSTGMFQTSQH
ncbi:hypothetical protein OCUAc20_46030 (plasmid) [Acinetobacter baumannii]|nr:hypothetical protein OCUAc20_23570 [Acinetobacter baumannii]BDE24381.1 hypothetical protein OCUAc20_28810 [Acinetobacter baumannii]BDE24410.1 hypothetical protein OCUAc20_29100 [Acinetobacter baumannii]BDE25145.1 hypothetical protein OCUAc20_36450 [Acinetobacter baumannii]BDE26103.1 hypothetical protein OCUAc20_46030 [Acinetobacter baumannii]